MKPFLRLLSFPVQPFVGVETADGIATMYFRPACYNAVPMDLAVTMDEPAFLRLVEHDCLLFGSRAGHLTVAATKRPKDARRLHHLLTGALPEYESLYRDGNPANLTYANLGFRTDAGYPWWVILKEGETDPTWSREGSPMRLPKAITSRREAVVGERPAYTPTRHRVLRHEAAFHAEMEEHRRRLRGLH